MGALAPVRLVQLLAGASSLEVSWAGEPAWSGLGWPSVTPERAVRVGGEVQAWLGDQVVLAGAAELSAGQRAQVALLGQVGGPTKVLTLPASKPGRRVRVVHAAVPLQQGNFRVTYDAWKPQQKLSFGQASEWFELPDLPVTSWSLDLSTDVRDAHFSFSSPVTQPTTLYVASTTTEDLLVYAVADDGSATQNGPPPAGARVAFEHLASGVGAATIELDGQPLAGGEGAAGALGWGERTTPFLVPPHAAEVRALDGQGATLAAATYNLQNFAQVSFALTGGPTGTTLVPILEDWWHLHPEEGASSRRSFLDARPASVSPVDLWGWSPGDGWSPLANQVTPGTVLELENVPTPTQLLGLDLDLDGVRDLRFPERFLAVDRGPLLFTITPEGVPWLWTAQYGSSYMRLPVEFTAELRVINLTDDLLPLGVTGPTPWASSWPTEVVTRQSHLFSLLRGPREVTLGGATIQVAGEPLTHTVVLALPGGGLLAVATPRQVEEPSVAVQLVNASDEVVSATLDGGASLGAGLDPHQAGPAAGGGQEVAVVRADGSTLTYALPALAAGATTLLVYGGTPAWPWLEVVHEGGQIERLLPRELTGEVHVVAVMPATSASALYLDQEKEPLSSGWGQWPKAPSVQFRYAQRAVPAGEHVVRVGSLTSAMEIPFAVAAGTLTRVFVLPDLSVRVLPSLLPSDEVMVLSTVQASGPSAVLLVDGQEAPLGTLVPSLPFGEVKVVPYPGEGRFPAVDAELDGEADWRSWLPVQKGSVVMTIGEGTKQAVVCVKGGWAGVQGKSLP